MLHWDKLLLHRYPRCQRPAEIARGFKQPAAQPSEICPGCCACDPAVNARCVYGRSPGHETVHLHSQVEYEPVWCRQIKRPARCCSLRSVPASLRTPVSGTLPRCGCAAPLGQCGKLGELGGFVPRVGGETAASDWRDIQSYQLHST